MAAANGTGTAAMLGRVERRISRADRGRWVQLRGVSTASRLLGQCRRSRRRWRRRNLRILWRNDRLYSQIPRPFWRDLAGIVAIGSCSSAADPLVRFLPLHEPIVVQFHCVIEIDFSSGEKRLFPICVFIKTQYEWSIDREHIFQWKNKSKTLNFNILNNRALQFLKYFLLNIKIFFILVLFFDNQMKAWNIYLFLIKWKLNPFIFWQTKRGLLLKLIHIIFL